VYFGEYERTVDYKGRFSVPGHLMTTSAETDWKQVMVLKGEAASLYVYELNNWRQVMDEAYRSMDDDESRLFMHRTLTDAHSSEVDTMRRISVPAALLQYAGIEKRMVIVGMFNRLELWNPDTWHEYLDTLADVQIPSIADLSRASIREVS